MRSCLINTRIHNERTQLSEALARLLVLTCCIAAYVVAALFDIAFLDTVGGSWLRRVMIAVW